MSIAILQAFNCRCLEIFVHDIYFFLFISKPRPNAIRACLILIQETPLIVFYWTQTYTKQRGKNNWSPIWYRLYLLYLPSASADGLTGFFRSEILTFDTQLNPHQHTERSSLDLLGPVSTGRYTVFFDPSQRGTILYLLLKWPLWPSGTQRNPHQHTKPSSLDLLRPVSTGHYTVFFRPVSTGHYTVFAFKMASMALWYSVKSAPTYRAEQS